VLRFAVLRLAVPRGDFAGLAVLLAAGFRDAVERVALVPADFARVDVLRAPEDLRADVLRAPPRADEADTEPVLALASLSNDHLPDMTRCAASATASAMIEPSLVALDIMLLAAADAVSAASSPASRIARRAFGLALIAAAAAASPAASISLLIAALASLSTVSLPDDREDFVEVFFADFAIASSPSRAGISL
jgi:hypothetical protein